MLKLISSLIILLVAIFFTINSISPYGSSLFMIMVIFLFLISGIIIAYFIASWKRGELLNNFVNSLSISYGITGLIYLAGYFYGSFIFILK